MTPDNRLWMFLLASAPFLIFLLWLTCWLIADAIQERRRERASARMARLLEDSGGNRDNHG